MSDTVRKQIRDAAKTLLLAAGDFSTNVYIGRHDRIAKAKLPAADIYMGRSEYEPISRNPAGGMDYEVHRDLVIEVTAKEVSGQEVEEALDILVESVLAALLIDRTLGGICRDMHPQEDGPDVDDAGSIDYGANAVVFVVITDETR